jgi:phytanoyl-CoA hydroxylase
MRETQLRFDAEQGGEYPEGLYSDRFVAPVVASLEGVGERELQRFREDGFLAIASVFSAAQVRSGLDGLESLLVEPRGGGIEFESWAADRLSSLDLTQRMSAVRKFMYYVDHEERLRALAYDGRLLSLLRRLLGSEDLTMFQDMALVKPPGGGREKPWHQDNAYFTLPPGTPIAGAWIALDEATHDNGCMHVIPGSHREGPVVHFRRRDWQICDTDVQTARDVTVPLPPGGVLLFDGLLHHGTPANRTSQARRAVQFHYTPAYAKFGTDEDRLAVFGSEGKDVSC